MLTSRATLPKWNCPFYAEVDVTSASNSCNILFVTLMFKAHAIRMSGFKRVESGIVFKYVIIPSSSWFKRIGWLKNRMAVPTLKKILKLLSTNQMSHM
jgi:hypothetical protein